MRNNILIFGEALFDHFPDGSRVLGGAPFNVAWHLQAFGLAPQFISRIGADAPGQEIIERMAAWGMGRDQLQTDPHHPTGSVNVTLQDGEPAYDIVVDSAYDFIDANAINKAPTSGILYHGTLALRNPVSCAALAAVKARHRGRIFIDVNLRPPWWDKSALIFQLESAAWVKLNEAELAALVDGNQGLEEKMAIFHRRFGLDTLVVTRGEKGALAFNGQHGFTAAEPAAATTVVDTVGAGDAFAAILLLGMANAWPLAPTLARAQDFASAIVGQRGATVSDTSFYEPFRADWTLTN